jgi:cell wall-associated NlpC family hydrolase
MAEHIELSRASRLAAAGLVGALVLGGVAGAAPSRPPTTAPNPPTSGPSRSTVPPRPMAADRSHPVFAPDGCPTTPPANTLRGRAASKHLSLYQICSDSVRAARSPAAALAIRFALSQLGTPYSQPLRNSPHIYDCSSFVSRAYQAAGVPIAYPDTPARIDGGPGQNTPGSRDEFGAPWAVPVSPLTAKPGDLVFFPGSDPPNGHVGMLLADGLLLHTNSTGDVAHVNTLNVAKATAWSAVDPTKVTTHVNRDATELALAAQNARQRYETASRDLVRIQDELAAVRRERDAAVRDVQAARDKQTVAARKGEVARDHLRQVAVAAYMHGGLADNAAMLQLATSIDELGRDQALLSAVGDKTRSLITAYEQARDAAVREVHDFQQRLDTIDARIGDLQLAATRAESALNDARGDPATPILGRAQLTAAELVAWYRSTGQDERTSVNIDVLAKLFIAEGNRAGVRGDVGFAAAAFDTGNFTFPDAGALSGHDNGLNLVGGCDTCQVPWYGSAQQAVRAHMQLLRTFADAAVMPTSFGKPPVVPGVLNTHAKGTFQSWSQLPGMVVPAPEYGTAIMNLYSAIATWVTAHPVPKRKPTSRHEAPSAPPKSHRVLLR